MVTNLKGRLVRRGVVHRDLQLHQLFLGPRLFRKK